MAQVMGDVMSIAIIVATLWGILVWIGGAILAAWVASENNRSGVAWLLFGLVLSPLLALVALAALPVEPR